MERTELDALARRHRVSVLVQHGSTVRGTTHARSDLDLAALFDGAPSLRERSELEAALAEAFPGQRVDLAVLNHADPLFLDRVVGHGRLIAGDPRAFAKLRLYAFHRYHDFRRYLRHEGDHVDRFVAARGGAR
ncbi:MAG: nucleotidyltransferase domain-containing protein [Vicinamibacteria bacterium]|nr:nucleotidyltransferase domain-containing protein [Vicinamibacteria bacterium]